MNRIAKELAEKLPYRGPFTDAEVSEMLMAYSKNPGHVPCPVCDGNWRCIPEDRNTSIEVLNFIEPEIDSNGLASVTRPEGEYAAAVQCHKCYRAIGILAGTGKNTDPYGYERDDEYHRKVA